MSRILISGGCGFIGSVLVKALADDHEITVIDNLSRGKMENLEGFIDKVEFIQYDMKLPIILGEYDYVFDLAARVYGITKLYEDEPGFLRENTSILLNTLECTKGRVGHYFYVSSSCVYNFEGCPKPHKEEDAIKIPKTGYDISKRFGEEIIKIYAKHYGFNYTIVRPFNVYGPLEGEEGPHVITDFFNRIIEERQKITGKFWILGSGEQTRSFTYVTDFVDAIVFLMGREEAKNNTFNVGTGIETKIIDLLRLCFKVSGVNLDEYDLEHRAAIKGDVSSRNPDVSKIMDLGWKSKYSLEEGLRESWIIENRNYRDGKGR